MKDEIKEIFLEQENQIDKYKTLKKLQEENDNLKQENERYKRCKKQKIKVENACSNYKYRIDKAIHRIQLLQMDGEVSIKDLCLIVKDLTGGDE